MSATSQGHTRQQTLLGIQHEVLEMIATGEPLSVAMDQLCRRVEEIEPGVTCSMVTVDDDGIIHPLAAPSMPPAYSAAIEGLPIGPAVGSCGTAAFRGEPVEVTDIASDPLWVDYQALAGPLHLKACWSSPLKARDGRVVGTFAFYYGTTRGASDLDREIVAACIHVCAIAIEHDMARSQMRRMAYRDAVTGLMNRVAFQERATQALARIGDGRLLVVHYMDVDEFKGINDTLGHRIGDLLLAAIADRLVETIGDAGTVARLGGDEFAVLQEAESRQTALQVGIRLLAAFNEPFMVEGHELMMGVSLGVAAAPDHGRSLNELMINADLALYRAKADGRGRLRFFVPQLAAAANARRAIERDLKGALEKGEFAIVYQPIVTLADVRIEAFEALLRWNCPGREPIGPAQFVPIAEEMGLIGQIGDWVLREACREAAAWPEHMALAVNLSPLQIRRQSLVDDVMATLEEVGLSPERLILEITETAILADEVAGRDALNRLSRKGIQIALDDFGTGYSSLRLLRSFPISKIKIDQSFVREITEARASAAIVRTMIALAKDLGMTTTAEGIENAEQARRLTDKGCTEAQGYFFSRPISAADVRTLIRAKGFAVADVDGGISAAEPRRAELR